MHGGNSRDRRRERRRGNFICLYWRPMMAELCQADEGAMLRFHAVAI